MAAPLRSVAVEAWELEYVLVLQVDILERLGSEEG